MAMHNVAMIEKRNTMGFSFGVHECVLFQTGAATVEELYKKANRATRPSR